MKFNTRLMSNVTRLLEGYHKTCGFYPSLEEGLIVLAEGSSECPDWRPHANIKDNLKDAYGEDLIYQPMGHPAHSFLLKSLGSDQSPGGDGDAADVELWSKNSIDETDQNTSRELESED
ncbi:MAG: type II secretion system protein GspG [Bdellovibrionales bacterium]